MSDDVRLTEAEALGESGAEPGYLTLCKGNFSWEVCDGCGAFRDEAHDEEKHRGWRVRRRRIVECERKMRELAARIEALQSGGVGPHPRKPPMARCLRCGAGNEWIELIADAVPDGAASEGCDRVEVATGTGTGDAMRLQQGPQYGDSVKTGAPSAAPLYCGQKGARVIVLAKLEGAAK